MNDISIHVYRICLTIRKYTLSMIYINNIVIIILLPVYIMSNECFMAYFASSFQSMAVYPIKYAYRAAYRTCVYKAGMKLLLDLIICPALHTCFRHKSPQIFMYLSGILYCTKETTLMKMGYVSHVTTEMKHITTTRQSNLGWLGHRQV